RSPAHARQRLRLAGTAATLPGSAALLRSRAPHSCALAHAHVHQHLPARRDGGDPARQRRTPALTLTHASASQLAGTAATLRAAPHPCALMCCTMRTLTHASASQLAGTAATLPGSAALLRSRA